MRENRINLLLLFAFGLLCSNANAQCVDESNYWLESWSTCDVTPSPNTSRGNTVWLMFEFMDPQAIATTQIWNANRVGESAQGGKTVFIDISTDGTTWTQVGSSAYTWPQGTELDNYEGFAGPDLTSFGFIKKILFTFDENHEQSTCVSIGELRFDINQDACYGEIDECGVCNGSGIQTYFQDADNDGLGNPNAVIESCELPNGYVENNDDNCDNGLIGWSSVSAIFLENGCTGCHNGPGGAGGLDLTSYEGISAGGNICGSNIMSGKVLADIISISNYDGCTSPIPFPSMNERVGGAIDADEIQVIQDWVDAGALMDCNCPEGAPDVDGDGICDDSDLCADFNDGLIGTYCDDGNPCTTMDVITSNCECIGMPSVDSDFDGVCDELDLAPYDPCTADGVFGMPEPTDWFANESNDCDLDGVLVSLGDLNDYDACINYQGSSLNPDCACANGFEKAGAQFITSFGMGNGIYAAGIPDSTLTWQIGSQDYLDLSFPYLEIETEICFTLGFGDPIGGVQFEVNDLGIYKFQNPDPTLVNFELQTVCFPTFVSGTQKVRISRYITGGIRIDGASYDYCPCTASDPKQSMNSCACPNDLTEDIGTYSESFGINNPEEADGAPDGIMTGSIGSGDSLILNYPSLPENYEICLDVLFTHRGGTISLDVNGENLTMINPAGFGEEGEVQKLCFKTNSSGSHTVVVKDIGSGSHKIDGSTCGYCNPCVADEDQDGICDDIDLCLLGDDQLDEDGDGLPDACDDCNGNLYGLPCDDGDNCTYDDIYDANCDCSGTPLYHELVDGFGGNLELRAIDSITLSGSFKVLSEGYFQAGKTVTILPGFETNEFTSLEIEIEDCEVGN